MRDPRASRPQAPAPAGPCNSHPGNLGIVEADALAELLPVDGDPIADLNLLADPQKNFLVLMKDGKIHKNLLR